MDLPEPLLAFPWPDHPDIQALADQIENLRSRYQRLQAAGRILPNTVEALRVELTYHSNAIEGSTLTLRDTQLIIEGREPNTGKTLREIYEARNHDRALRLLEQWVASRPAKVPITERDLLDLHAQVMADIDPARAGLFRQDRVLISGTRFVPPGAHKFATLMPLLLDLANQPSQHPVLKAAEFHYNVVAVHPFADGNGRTARLIMNYFLLRQGYSHLVVPVERRPEYLAALEEANAGRTKPLVVLIMSCTRDSLLRLMGDEEEWQP